MPRVVSGFEVGRFTPESVLVENGLDARATVDALVAASVPHDTGNVGYLSKAELQRGADDLKVSLAGAPTVTSTDSFEYARATLASVKAEHLTGVPGRAYTDGEVVAAAAQWDDGNGYLKKSELQAGALELQMTAASGQPLRAADIASIRMWTGAARKAQAELGIISDIDKTLMPPERSGVAPPAYPGIAALINLLEKGPQGTGALGDTTYVTARNPARVTTMDAWLAANDLPAGKIETGTVQFPLHVAENNKVEDIEGVLRAHPTQEFVLFGDTNHRDPDVYTRIRDMFPAQVKSVVIHDVKTIDPARLAGHHVVKNYAEAAAVLLKDGVIDEAGARSVMQTAKAQGLVISDGDIDALVAAHRP